MANIGIFFGTDTGKTRKIAKNDPQAAGGAPPPPRSISTAPRWRTCWPTRPCCWGRRRWATASCRASRPGARASRGPSLSATSATLACRGKRWRCLASAISVAIRITSPAGCGRCTTPLRARGATMIGSWPNEGYEFSASSALEGDRFVGLVLDRDNQFDETDARLATA